MSKTTKHNLDYNAQYHTIDNDVQKSCSILLSALQVLFLSVWGEPPSDRENETNCVVRSCSFFLGYYSQKTGCLFKFEKV